MANFHDRTAAPVCQRGLLRAAGRPCAVLTSAEVVALTAEPFDRRAIGRDGWARARDIAARLGGGIRDHVAEGMRQAWAAARGLSPAEPEAMIPASVADLPSAALLRLPAPLPSLSAALSRRRAIFGAAAAGEPDMAAEARRTHLRRQLAEAAEHGAALLASLGLPRPVTPGFAPLDPAAIGDAVESAVAALDAMDGDTDREPYLAGYYNPLADPTGEGEPSEDDEDDGISEPSLGVPENHPGSFHFDMDGRYHVGRARQPLGDQATWAAGGSHDEDAEAVNEDGDDLDRGEMQEGELEPWLGAPEGSQFCRGDDRDLEQDGEIERPWWGRHAAGWNDDGGRYA